MTQYEYDGIPCSNCNNGWVPVYDGQGLIGQTECISCQNKATSEGKTVDRLRAELLLLEKRRNETGLTFYMETRLKVVRARLGEIDDAKIQEKLTENVVAILESALAGLIPASDPPVIDQDTQQTLDALDGIITALQRRDLQIGWSKRALQEIKKGSPQTAGIVEGFTQTHPPRERQDDPE